MCGVVAATWVASCRPAPPAQVVPPPEEPAAAPMEPVVEPLPRLFDPVVPPFVACAPELGDALASALAIANIEADVSLEGAHLGASTGANLLDEVFVSHVTTAVRRSPLAARCVTDAITVALDRAATSRRPVEDSIRAAAEVMGWPIPASVKQAGDFASAVAALCAYEGGGPCEASGALSAPLAEALAPILGRILDAAKARDALGRVALEARGAAFWSDDGGSGLLQTAEGPAFDPAYGPDRSFLRANRSALYQAAAELAAAVESVDWSRFRGAVGERFDLDTPLGRVRVRDAGDDTYDGVAPVLLSIDLGGDDVYLDPTGGNASGANSVSVAVDLDGDDLWAYPEAGDDAASRELPADDDGRLSLEAQLAGASVSGRSRQGGARYGVAMVFDLGGGDDRYVALRASQGYAHHGVGVLFDEGGDDRYRAESAAQGAAQFGIGLAIDLGGGADVRDSVYASQGFGFAGGFGALYDDGGDDAYVCDPGDPDRGGQLRYPSPQLPGHANTSLCQGAGFGWRSDDPSRALAGGVGVLRDAGGADRYVAGVYAQGVGYWEGAGLLLDGEGADVYEAQWYALGAGAHYGVGVLDDRGPGDDLFGVGDAPQHMSHGAGHHFAVGIFFSQAGDDTYALPTMSAGAATCGSFGLFEDEDGADTYLGRSPLVAGVASTGNCGDDRGRARTMGLMIDAAGDDDYRMPVSGARDGGRWGTQESGAELEHAAGVDLSRAPG